MTGPLFDITVAVARIAVFFSFCLGLVVVMTWVERKGAAYIQDRRGPNRADILGVRAWGLFHPLADALKFLFKEDFIPDNAHRLFYQMAPMFSLAPAIMTIAVIPFGPDVTVMGRTIALQIADLNVGILYLFAISGMSVYGVILAGWSSGSKYPLLGGLRASAQMLSYEVSMGLSLIGIFMVFESVRMSQIVAGQGGLLFGVLPKWGVFVQPLGFILFLVAQYAEANRTPFDLPEGESELVAGYHTEYGSFKLSMFMMAEYLTWWLARPSWRPSSSAGGSSRTWATRGSSSPAAPPWPCPRRSSCSCGSGRSSRRSSSSRGFTSGSGGRSPGPGTTR